MTDKDGFPAPLEGIALQLKRKILPTPRISWQVGRELREKSTPNLDSTTSNERSTMPSRVCTLDKRSRERVRHASSSPSSRGGESIRLLHSRHRLANCLLDNTRGRLGIEFAWLITDEDGLTFDPRPLGVSDHDTAGEIHRRRMKFLSNGDGSEARRRTRSRVVE